MKIIDREDFKMNAIEFVKQNGIEKAKQIVELFTMSTLISIDGVGVSISDLKQIVEAFEWVEKFGGLDGFKDEYMSRIENNECVSGMDKVIELVEQCNES